MNYNYPKAYKEVIEILKYVPQESVNKIPDVMINLFKIKMDESWDFEVDLNKSFEEQNILNETKAIFANIFQKYWATPYQRERIEERDKYELEKDNENINKYNYNEIFKKKEIKKDNKEIEQNLPVEVKKERFFKKMLKFFQKIFNIN